MSSGAGAISGGQGAGAGVPPGGAAVEARPVYTRAAMYGKPTSCPPQLARYGADGLMIRAAREVH